MTRGDMHAHARTHRHVRACTHRQVQVQRKAAKKTLAHTRSCAFARTRGRMHAGARAGVCEHVHALVCMR
eukprot:6197245-Pleurochrysis_carterae.AAC.3